MVYGTLAIGHPVGHANGQCYSLGGSLGNFVHMACNRVNKGTSGFLYRKRKGGTATGYVQPVSSFNLTTTARWLGSFSIRTSRKFVVLPDVPNGHDLGVRNPFVENSLSRTYGE